MVARSIIKRKGIDVASSRKKRKLLDSGAKTYTSPDSLPWRVLSRPIDSGLDGDDGILGLEEVEGVEVVYEEGPDGAKVARFNVLNNRVKSDEDDEEVAGPSPTGEISLERDGPKGSIPTPTDDVPMSEPLAQNELESEVFNDLPEWNGLGLHAMLLRYLQTKHFVSPTPIQASAIPLALEGRDVIGVAETGSGKTLAYGLPILQKIISDKLPVMSGSQISGQKKKKRALRALVLAPTRELALQVTTHLNECMLIHQPNDGRTTPESSRSKPPPILSIASIVGGMSSQKQRRILDRGVDILVATPGRLWDTIQEDESLAREIKHLRFLVLDEADRMIEQGHFAELDNILRLTLRENREDQIDAEFNDEPDVPPPVVGTREEDHGDALQTFVFSATLSKDLQRNLTKRRKLRSKVGNDKHRKGKEEPASTLDDLLTRLDFRDPQPQVIDISPQGGVVSTLRESKIECLANDKDVYLYYFLLRYPGRSLVFLSAIDGIRRLTPLLETLELRVLSLHSQMEQRARLKNLDRFKSASNVVLLATDVASRGLDIPAVDHVIHYQIPKTADTYVHRNGRTARAKREGVSLLLCAPDERKLVRALMNSLSRDSDSIPELSVELNISDKLKARIQLAKKIESAHHKTTKENHERKWLKETAEAMEIELDDEMFNSDSDDQRSHTSKHTRKVQSTKISQLKAELKRMLSQPLVARGVSTKYITSGSRPIVDDILAGASNESLLGLKQTGAGADIDVAIAQKKRSKRPAPKSQPIYEEWNGVSSSQ